MYYFDFNIPEELGTLLGFGGVAGMSLLGIILLIISWLMVLVLAWFVVSLVWGWAKRIYWFVTGRKEPFECDMIGWDWIERMLNH